MARGRRGGAPRGFKFSGRGKHSFRAGKIARKSTGGTTKSKTPGFK